MVCTMENTKGPERVLVTIGKAKADSIAVDGKVFRDLFENSHVYSMVHYQHGVESGQITFLDLKELARKADIPYSLFFAPEEFVQEHIQRKSDLLLSGASKDAFSLNSRGTVEIRDVELIIKDILRKQTLPKKTLKEADNPIVGMLKGSKLTVPQQAAKVRDAVGIDLAHVATLNKEKTFDYFVGLLGQCNIFVSQSSVGHMPQTIQRHVKFSGMCIKDKVYPFIFLNNKDDEPSFEPQGRKILTLTLLLVCITKAKFSAVTYSERAKDLIKEKEFEIAEEILMPAADLATASIASMEELAVYAAQYNVTPSAFLMRLRRLGRIGETEAEGYFEMLKDEYANRKPHGFGHPAEATAFLKYNSAPYSAKVFELLDRGALNHSDARRILLQNRQKASFLEELRSKL